MPRKSSNAKPACNSKANLDLEKLKNGEIQAAKIDFAQINIRTLAKHKCVK